MSNYYIGVDLGGTKILTAISNDKGEILKKIKLPTEAEKGKDHIIDNIVKSIENVMKSVDADSEKIIRIGLGSPGPLNLEEGIIYTSPNLYWENVPVVKILEERIGIEVSLENDANAAALGEKWFGAGKGINNMIYMTVSTGIGGGIIIDNKILHGVNYGAGEIGHFIIEKDGPLCGCGNNGCFEAVASGTALNRKGKYLASMNPESLLYKLVDGDFNKIDGKVIAKAAEMGDKLALGIWADEAINLGIGIANLLNIFNTEMVVLGGGVMNAWELFYDEMMKTIKEYAFESVYNSVEIRRSVLGSDVGVIGAIAVAMEDRLLK